MNYRRGLLRLWLFASVLWIGFMGWLYASEIATGLQSRPVAEVRQEEPESYEEPTAGNSLKKARETYIPPKRESDEQAAHLRPNGAMLPGIARAAFLPPLGLLALGALLGWAVRGFKPTP